MTSRLLLVLLFFISSYGYGEDLRSEIIIYKDCDLKNISFEAYDHKINFICDSEEQSFSLSGLNLDLEAALRRNFVRPSTLWRGRPGRNLEVLSGHFARKRIIGFSTSEEINSYKLVDYRKETREIVDYEGNVLMVIDQDKLAEAIKNKNNYSQGPLDRFFMGDHTVVRINTDPRNRGVNFLRRVENCFPKNCGITTIIDISESSLESGNFRIRI